MRLTEVGKDIININEDVLNSIEEKEEKIHLIKLSFFSPTVEKINAVLTLFPSTNRYVIENNIKLYNSILKNTNKKYYIENSEGNGFISFFRKNNKVLLNVNRLIPKEKQFLFDVCLVDVLRNIEIILLPEDDFNEFRNIFDSWNGNVIVYNEKSI